MVVLGRKGEIEKSRRWLSEYVVQWCMLVACIHRALFYTLLNGRFLVGVSKLLSKLGARFGIHVQWSSLVAKHLMIPNLIKGTGPLD